MADGHSRKKGKKNRKWSRNVDYCKFYRLSQKRERNKVIRLKKHLKKFPDDVCAKNAVERCKALLH